MTVVWTVTSSALRAPPLMLLGKYAAKPAIPYLSSLAMLGYGIAGALGYQMHFALDSAPLFLRFAKPAELEWLMPVFWIGFNIAMFPASVVTNRLGGYAVMGVAALIGAALLYLAVAGLRRWTAGHS